MYHHGNRREGERRGGKAKAISSVRRTRKICEHRHTGSQHLAECPPPRIPSRRGGSRGGPGGGNVLPLPKTNSLPVLPPPRVSLKSTTMTSTRTLAFAGRNYQPRRETIYIRFDSRFRGKRTLLSTFLGRASSSFFPFFFFSRKVSHSPSKHSFTSDTSFFQNRRIFFFFFFSRVKMALEARGTSRFEWEE